MALHIAHPETDDEPAELIGIRLDRPAPPRYRELLSEVEMLRAVVAAKDAHIASLETQVWAWRSQAGNEMRAHKADQAAAWERECELIRVIHHQTLLLQEDRESGDEPSRRHWWRSA